MGQEQDEQCRSVFQADRQRLPVSPPTWRVRPESATVPWPHPTWRRPGLVSFRRTRSRIYSMRRRGGQVGTPNAIPSARSAAVRRGVWEPALPASIRSAAAVQGHGRRCLCGTSPSPLPCFWHKATNPRGFGTASPRATEVRESRMSANLSLCPVGSAKRMAAEVIEFEVQAWPRRR